MNTHYCVGFLFDSRFQRVLLVEKRGRRESWQKGLYNGIGGLVQFGESSRAAMLRKGSAEAGLELPVAYEWTNFACLRFDNQTQLDVFHASNDVLINRAHTKADENIDVFPVHRLPENCIDDVPWMINMAIASARGRLPFYSVEVG